MMFKFVVRKLRWLARIPVLPQLFDAGLMVATMLFDRPRLRAMEMFENAIRRKYTIQRRPHRFGGVGFFIGTTEIGHLHGNGLLDLFVGKSLRAKEVRRGRALPHHVFPDSGWISFWLKSPADITQALELFEIASMYRTSGPAHFTRSLNGCRRSPRILPDEIEGD
jgi:hypothetical protein